MPSASSKDIRIGNREDVFCDYNGVMDEVAVWSRGLSETELMSVYLRGLQRLKFQVRKCTNETCTTNPTWRGPDGSNLSYFSVLHNNTAFSAAGYPTGDVLASFANLDFSNFSDFLAAFGGSQQYFQYRAIFESSDASTTCSSTWCSPELKSTTFAP